MLSGRYACYQTYRAADGRWLAVGALEPKFWALLCEKLGRKFEVHWCASPACSRNCLRSKRCDVILGHPLDDAPPNEIAFSVPYAGARFALDRRHV